MGWQEKKKGQLRTPDCRTLKKGTKKKTISLEKIIGKQCFGK